MMNAGVKATALKFPFEKFAVRASAWRPMVSPRMIKPANATVLTTVNVVCTHFPSLIPRRLIQVRTQMLIRAISRCGDNPSCTGAPAVVKSI